VKKHPTAQLASLMATTGSISGTRRVGHSFVGASLAGARFPVIALSSWAPARDAPTVVCPLVYREKKDNKKDDNLEPSPMSHAPMINQLHPHHHRYKSNSHFPVSYVHSPYTEFP